jgi:hypothetical protein
LSLSGNILVVMHHVRSWLPPPIACNIRHEVEVPSPDVHAWQRTEGLQVASYESTL